MHTRRQFLTDTLKGSSLLALGAAAPAFLKSAAFAAANAQEQKDNILVVLEMAGGNDGLNTVIPFADDEYLKARPTLRMTKSDVVRVNDEIGLHPGLRSLETLLENHQLAILQGVGYPNPNRSHFESMDIWQTADPRLKDKTGWLGRSIGHLNVKEGHIPAFHVSQSELPMAFERAATAVPTLHPDKPFDFQFGGAAEYNDGESSERILDASQDERYKQRRKLISDLTDLPADDANAMLQFVQQASQRTYATIDQLRDILSADFQKPDGEYQRVGNDYRLVREGLEYELQLVARMIQAEFGTRIYYVSLDGFDTHSGQSREHASLLEKLADAISNFYSSLEQSGDASRVLLVTFSEFGRRVKENGSEGTDHGAASCMFAAGPAVKGGLIGRHPSLDPDELADGDLKYHTDFRQVYAAILDRWLACDSRVVLGGNFAHVDFLASR